MPFGQFVFYVGMTLFVLRRKKVEPLLKKTEKGLNRSMIKKFVFPINQDIYENVTTAIQKTLTKNEKDRKNILQIMVSAEDVL